MNEMARATTASSQWLVGRLFGSLGEHHPLDRGPSYAPWCLACKTEWPCKAVSGDE